MIVGGTGDAWHSPVLLMIWVVKERRNGKRKEKEIGKEKFNSRGEMTQKKLGKEEKVWESGI